MHGNVLPAGNLIPKQKIYVPEVEEFGMSGKRVE